GLGLQRPASDGRPRYVTDIDPDSGTVAVGSAEDLEIRRIRAREPRWTTHNAPVGAFRCVVQVRAHGGLAPAEAELVDGEIRLDRDEPVTGGARGQAAVLYRPEGHGAVARGGGTSSGAGRAGAR